MMAPGLAASPTVGLPTGAGVCLRAPERLGASCPRCGAPLLSIAELEDVARDVGDCLAAHPEASGAIRATVGVCLLASLLPCFAGLCQGGYPPAANAAGLESEARR